MDIENLFRNGDIEINDENVKVNIFFYGVNEPLLGMNIDQGTIHSDTQFITICDEDANTLVLVPKRDIMRIEMFAGEKS